MRIAVSKTERGEHKALLRSEMKEYLIKVKDVADQVPYHIQTVKSALKIDSSHWNQAIMDKGWELVMEKKSLETTIN